MKRLNLVLFGVLLLNFSVFALIGGTTQRGKATHEMDSKGFFVAHSSFPLGASVKVVNTVTGKGIDAVVNGRIPATPDRIVDLSKDLWTALGLAEGAVVMLVYVPSQVTRPPLPNVDPFAETNFEGMARLKATQPLYQLLILDRRNCEPDSDVSDLQNIEVIYKFPHGVNGYLVLVYVSSGNGPVFPEMPDKSRIIVNLMTTDLTFLREYTNSSPFKRFVTNKQVISQLRKAIK